MASGNTIFITYVLIPTGQTIGSGYTEAIHCNYISKLQVNSTNPYIIEINLNFPNISDFKFLSNNTTGYTANKIHAIVQIVDNTPFNTIEDVKPDSTQWKYFDMTNQVIGYTGILTPANLISQVFKVSLIDYTGSTFSSYTLQYLDYPSASQVNNLSFGEATYFFGNVATKIMAEVYTTEINIDLHLSEFNSSTNLTWNSGDVVYISEIGIYDGDKNLVAIGKLNDPVAKDATIARTIVFALDF
jgi:hypothetical protein